MNYLWVIIFFVVQTSLAIAQPPPKRGGFQHSAGLKGSLYNFGDDMDPMYGVTLRTKFNLINNWSDFSGSINAGISGEYHSKSAIDSNSFFAADLPLSLEMNIGHLATKDFRNFLGFFAGAGYAFTYLNEEITEAPFLTTGIRTWLFGQSFSIRYIKYLPQDNFYTMEHSLSILINFGEYLAAVKANNRISDFMKPYPKYPQ